MTAAADGPAPGSRRRIVVATADSLGAVMAGPGIRAVQIAAALSAEHDVVLATSSTCSLTPQGFEARTATPRQLRELEAWCDVFLFQGFVMASNPWLAETEKVLVVDVYDPMHLEQLEQAKDLGPAERSRIVQATTVALNEQLLRADFLLCASERQRDFWLGQLAALGRLNPTTYDDDETLRSLIAVVPFGLSGEPPSRRRPVVRGVVPGIEADDEVLLWGGGVYNWFDPLTLLRAVDRLRARRPKVRLFFLGLRHPNPDAPTMRMALQCRELADELGLTGRHVFFNEGWVPYDERGDYLLEADLGVTTHLDHVESAFSFRTRVLDYLWAGLPYVSTAGDSFGDLARRAGVGLTVPPGDVEALEEALFRLLDDPALRESCRTRISEVVPGLTWSVALAPLLEFCRSARRAPDLVTEGGTFVLDGQRLAPPPPGPTSLRGDLELLRTYLRDRGVVELAKRVRGRVARRTRERLGGFRRG